MPDFIVSRAAQADLQVIARYTAGEWGSEQAKRYVAIFHVTFARLAEFPELGRACEEISLALRRHELARHVIFYRLCPGGVRITRVLHQRMIPKLGRMDV